MSETRSRDKTWWLVIVIGFMTMWVFFHMAGQARASAQKPPWKCVFWWFRCEDVRKARDYEVDHRNRVRRCWSCGWWERF